MKNRKKTGFAWQTIKTGLLFLSFLCMQNVLWAEKNDDLLDQFILAKGSGIITFDASNIKQFWIDNSVVSRDDIINIILSSAQSRPFKIQLANVNESQDCKIEIITNQQNVGFEVLNSKEKVVSKSAREDDFVQYHIISSSFHLEDTQNGLFYIRFLSSEEILSIKKIILSFSPNKDGSFLASPGKLNVTSSNCTVRNGEIVSSTETQMDLTGKTTSLYLTKKIICSDEPVNLAVKVTNTGEIPADVYVGYVVYTKGYINLGNMNYPYKGINNVLSVISSEDNSASIIVDSYPQWEKRCTLAINAKEDNSDIPNTTIIEGHITEIKQLDDGTAEIIIDKSLSKGLSKGTRIRVHGGRGGDLYISNKRLQPGQEVVINSTIKKDSASYLFSSNALPIGTYYIIPIIRSYSAGSSEENTIRISDFTVSF